MRGSGRAVFMSRFGIQALLLIALGTASPAIFSQASSSDGNPTKDSQLPKSDVEAVSSPPKTQAAKAKSDVKTDSVKIEFDESENGIVLVSSGGKSYRVNTLTKEVVVLEDGTKQDSPAEPVPDSNKESEPGSVQDEEEEEDPFFYEPGDEPFDYRVVNIPTPKMVPKGTWNLSFSHRFTQPIHPISSSADSLLGFDSFSVSSFQVAFGITDKLYVSAARSPICRRGLCKTIEIGAGYHFTDQNKKSPVGVSVYGSVEGDMNFSRDFTTNFQVMLSRRIGKRVHLFFSPAVHLFSNGGRRFDPAPEDFFPPAPIALNYSQPKHGVSYGFGTVVMITPSLAGTFEFVPRTGFQLGRVTPILGDNFEVTGFENSSFPSIGFGIQKNIGNHSFAFTLTNSQTTTTSRYNSSNLQLSPRRLVVGFNLFRRF
ncbi:MAG: hypothetical protein HKN33_18800 [Pyrinomonadaceae bacterium]|nr:hypothetical protein [Pyrinomonadaceae bacterium]